MFKSVAWLSLWLAAVVITGCGGTSIPAAQGQLVAARIEVIPSNTPHDKRAIGPAETIAQPNCEGSSFVSNEIERSHAVLYSMDVGGEVTVYADGTLGIPGVGSVQAGAEVAAKYGVTYGEEERVTRSLTVSAKEGTSMIHTIQQYEYWETGEIVVTVGNTSRRVPYNFRRDFGIELLSSRNADECGPTSEPQSTAVVVSGNAGSNCQGIIGKVPDTPQQVRERFGIPADKGISLFYEICQEAPNGFIVEESPTLFTIQVPQGGCIDSYSGARFSDATVPEQLGGGRRAYSGTVTTTSLTYRVAGCELKP